MTLCELSLALPGRLLPWYGSHARDLPWRQDRQPYHILLSEIMLQQTRVEAVRAYYLRFLDRLPTIEALAEADEQTLLKLWEGLGYYSRVRNLQMAARAIVAAGGFPTSREGLLALPGVGAYTAGAVGSICFDLPTPAVDGNVLRLLSRLRDDDRPIDDPKVKQEVTQALAEVYPREAGAFTQALMELGATLCGPNREPQCEMCPCQDFCLGYLRGTAKDLPVKAPKRAKRVEEKTVYILRCGDRYALRKRPNKGLLAGLWEFPNIPGRFSPEEALKELEALGIQPKQLEKAVSRKHIFTHIVWDMTGIYAEAESEAPGFTWLTAPELEASAALPTAFRLFWEER